MSSKGTYPWSLAYPCALRAPGQVCNKVKLRCVQRGLSVVSDLSSGVFSACADADCTPKLLGRADLLQARRAAAVSAVQAGARHEF